MARQTPLYDAHRALGARMVDFAGWDMPVQYQGVIDEHEAVRNAAGLFDVSHMGEIELRGAGALDACQRAHHQRPPPPARRAGARTRGLLNPQGGFVDDVVAYRFSAERVLICVNAATVTKDFAWMREHATGVTPVDGATTSLSSRCRARKAAAIWQR